MQTFEFHQSLAKLDTCLNEMWTVESCADHQIRLFLKNAPEITLEFDARASGALFSLEDLLQAESNTSFYEVKQVFQILGLLRKSDAQEETEAQTQAWAQLLSDPVSIPEASSGAHEGDEAIPYHVSVLLYLLQFCKKEASEDLKNLLPLFMKQLHHTVKQRIYAEPLAKEQDYEQYLLKIIQTEIKDFKAGKQEAKLAVRKLQLAWLEMRARRENQPENEQFALIQDLKSEVTELERIRNLQPVPTMDTQLERILQEANASLDDSDLEALIQELLTLRCDYIFRAAKDPKKAFERYEKRQAVGKMPPSLKKADEILETLLLKKYHTQGNAQTLNINYILQNLHNNGLDNITQQVMTLLFDNGSVDPKLIRKLKRQILRIQGEYEYALFVSDMVVKQSKRIQTKKRDKKNFSGFITAALGFSQSFFDRINCIYQTLSCLQRLQNRYQDEQVQFVNKQIADIKEAVSAIQKDSLDLDIGSVKALSNRIMMMHDNVARAIRRASTLKDCPEIYKKDIYSLLEQMDDIHVNWHHKWAESIKEESLQLESELKAARERVQIQGIVEPIKTQSDQGEPGEPSQLSPIPENTPEEGNPNEFIVSIEEHPEFPQKVAPIHPVEKVSSIKVQNHTPPVSVKTMNPEPKPVNTVILNAGSKNDWVYNVSHSPEINSQSISMNTASFLELKQNAGSERNLVSHFTLPKFNSKFIVLISVLAVLGSGILGYLGAPLWGAALVGVFAAGIMLGLNVLSSTKKEASQANLPILDSEPSSTGLLNARQATPLYGKVKPLATYEPERKTTYGL